MIKLSTYLRQYKVGDIVDIKANGAVQKGSVQPPSNGSEYLGGSEIGELGTEADEQQYATQGLPRKDWSRLQRHKERSRCHHLQESQAPVHREARQSPSRARFTLPIERRVRPPSQEQRRAEEEVKVGGYPRPLEETAFDATRVENHFHEGQRTRDCRSDRIRDHHLKTFGWQGLLGFLCCWDEHHDGSEALALHDTIAFVQILRNESKISQQLDVYW